MTVSLVLPCYNPPQGWEQTVLSNYNIICGQVGRPIQLIIVLDGGNGATRESLRLLEQHVDLLRIISYAENRGKGYAIRKGVAEAAGDIILYTDVDFPYSLRSMYSIYDALATNDCDVAVGVKNADYYKHVPPLRRAISRYLQLLTKAFLSMPITDTQCGLKGFRNTVKPLFLKTTIDRYLFDLEFVRSCFKSKKYRVKPIPVQLNENIHFRSMNYRILLPEMLNFIKLLFK
jgi:glycosyltransferase involved in cell wall biosynthesis